MPAKLDLTGHRFGLWSVLREASDEEKTEVQRIKKEGAWLCRCDCGVEHIVRTGALRSGASKSCGGLQHRKNNIAFLAAAGHTKRIHGEKHECLHNSGVDCDLLECEGCGWMPEIEKARKTALRKP